MPGGGGGSSWAYDPGVSRRDLRLDFLRGVCLVKMVFNHLWHTPAHRFQEWLGFVSAAEGFFFISGAVVGIVHGRRVAEGGLAPSSRTLLTRAGHLYLANLALAFSFLALESGGWLAGNHFSRFWQGGELEWGRLFALNLPYHLHVLPRYVVFLALTPLALWCLTRGRTAWLLVASGGLYLLSLGMVGEPRLPGLESGGLIYFPVLPWQMLFFAGMACGYHRRRLAALWRRLPSAWLAAALGLAAVAFALLKRGWEVGRFPLPPDLVAAWLGRTGLGPGRLVNLAVVFGLCFLLVDRFWRPLARSAGPVLLPIGQRSLYVFLVHILIVGLGMAWLPAVAGEVLSAPWVLLALDLALVGLLWMMVRTRFLFDFVPN